MAEDLMGKASAEGVAEFDAFWAHLTAIEPAEESRWIDAHGLDSECVAARLGG